MSESEFWADVRAEGRPIRHAPGDHNAWFEYTRGRAELIECRDCGQPVGATCVKVGTDPPQPLTRFPAHVHRIHDSEKVPLR